MLVQPMLERMCGHTGVLCMPETPSMVFKPNFRDRSISVMFTREPQHACHAKVDRPLSAGCQAKDSTRRAPIEDSRKQ
eukprot:1960497-Amphidinium_carterae.1